MLNTNSILFNVEMNQTIAKWIGKPFKKNVFKES